MKRFGKYRVHFVVTEYPFGAVLNRGDMNVYAKSLQDAYRIVNEFHRKNVEDVTGVQVEVFCEGGYELMSPLSTLE